MGGGGKILSFEFVTGYISAEGLTLDIGTLIFYREVKCAQRIISGLDERYIVHRQRNRGATLCIQLMGLNLCVLGVMESVIDLERTALQTYLFVSWRSRIIIVIIVLMSGHAELVCIRIEYRCAE